MGEGAPKKEQGTARTPESEGGSIDDFITEVETKTHGIERIMSGISTVGEIASNIQQLGTLGQEHPEFRHWVDRQLSFLRDISEKAKNGQNIDQDMITFYVRVRGASQKWEDSEITPHLKEWFRKLQLVRTAMQYSYPVGKDGKRLATKELGDSIKTKDSALVDSMENEIIIRPDLTMFEMRDIEEQTEMLVKRWNVSG